MHVSKYGLNTCLAVYSLEGLLNSTNGPTDQNSPSEYMIIYITALQSGLLRVHLTSHTDR